MYHDWSIFLYCLHQLAVCMIFSRKSWGFMCYCLKCPIKTIIILLGPPPTRPLWLTGESTEICAQNMYDGLADYTYQSSDLPTLATRRRYLKLCFLHQAIQGQFDFPGAPVVMRNVPLNLSIFLLLRPVTCSNAHQISFFPSHLLTYRTPSPSCTYLWLFELF